MRPARNAATWIALLLVMLSSPAVLRAQNQATLTTVYTALNTTATAAALNAGRIVVGYVDLSILCRRNNATCTVSFSAPTTTPTVRYVLLAAGAGTPTTASCSTAVPAASTALYTGPGNNATTSRRLYICVDMSWTTAPTTVAPTITFQATNG